MFGMSSPAFGFAAESFLTIERANISIDEGDNELSAELIAEGPSIPLNGTEGAFGYVEQCEEDKGIVDITWQSPGEVNIDDETATIRGVPTDEIEGWDSITGENISMALGEGVNEAISFKLEPVYGGGDDDGLEAICVTDIRSAEEEEVTRD